jgi:hypothetical protein
MVRRDKMCTRLFRFTSRLAVVGVILFINVGTALIERRMEIIVTPTSAGGGECAAISENAKLPEPSVRECGQDGTEDLIPIQWIKDESNKWFDDVIGTTQSSNGGDTTVTPPEGDIETTSNTSGTDAPAKQVLTEVRTKIKCVETILKNAVIEPYLINGQIEGLRITGLDRILLAKDLLLKSGDIIRTVNGQPLNSKRGAYKIFKRARKRPIMKVELLRDGKTETLLYYLR